MNQFFMQFINGLNIGSIYALIALGYTMVYGIAKLINFAHGDVTMVACGHYLYRRMCCFRRCNGEGCV